MNGKPPGPDGGGRLFALALAVLLLARIASVPWGFHWRDGASIVLVASLVVSLRPGRDPAPVLSGAGAWLFALYLMGQLPHLLSLWKLAP